MPTGLMGPMSSWTALEPMTATPAAERTSRSVNLDPAVSFQFRMPTYSGDSPAVLAEPMPELTPPVLRGPEKMGSPAGLSGYQIPLRWPAG
jgi:hypothetical protein